MFDSPAFTTSLPSSTFLGQSIKNKATTCSASRTSVSVSPRMQFRFLEKIPNPFKKKESASAVTEKKPEAGKAAASKPAPKKGISLPVTGGVATEAPKTEDIDVTKVFRDSPARGLKLLAEDLLKNLPEASGVGRQDVGMVMKPQFGEPGYKPQAYETVKVSKLGLSPFSDDKNYTGKVGSLDAVKKAAKEANLGKSAKEIKADLLKQKADEEETDAFGKKVAPQAAASMSTKPEAPKPKEYPLPDYLMPLPEDKPRKGMTWKNYVGR